MHAAMHQQACHNKKAVAHPFKDIGIVVDLLVTNSAGELIQRAVVVLHNPCLCLSKGLKIIDFETWRLSQLGNQLDGVLMFNPSLNQGIYIPWYDACPYLLNLQLLVLHSWYLAFNC